MFLTGKPPLVVRGGVLRKLTAEPEHVDEMLTPTKT